MLQIIGERKKLRDYQEHLVAGCRNAMRTCKRLVAYLPTGGGKTAVGTAIIQMAIEKGKRVAFICNRVQLIQQTSDAFDQAGIAHGILQGANTRGLDSDVLVCSIQTIRARGGLPENIDLLIIDECHGCAGTEEYQNIMQGRFVIGLTATPYQKGLGRNIAKLGGPLFETVVVGANMRDLQERKWLVEADVWAPADPDLSDVKTVAGDYKEDQLAQAMDKPQLIGDIVSHWFKLAAGKQTMGFFVDIAHSRHVCDEFVRSGVKAVHVDYHMTDEEKAEIYRAFKAGEHTVLCNCALLSEGADFPACEVLILARPTKSRVRYVQMFGRVLRPSPGTGKERAIVLDHGGTVKRLGFPWDFTVTHLDDGKPKKATGSEPKEKPEALPNPCPHCSFMKPPKTPKCPNCGFESRRPSEVEMQDGDLVPLTKNAKAAKGVKGLEEIGRTRVYHQLLWLAHERGYKEGWAAMKYKDAFGCWPNGIPKSVEPPCGTVLSWERSQRIKWAKGRAA